MKKRVIAALLDTILAISLTPAAYAATPVATVPLSVSPDSEIRIYVDGSQVKSDVKPFILNDRTMIPIGAVARTLGAVVTWEGSTRTVTISRAWVEIKMVIDDINATVNGEPEVLAVAPLIVNDRTFLPLRFISEHFSQNVRWDGAERAVYITEDMSFAYEDRNIKDWILGCSAILARSNSGDPYSIGMKARSEANSQWARSVLSGSWGCDDRADLIETILRMIDYGHAEDFAYDAWLASQFTDEEFEELLKNSSETDKFMWKYVKALDEKWGDRGIKAWDWFRMCHLAGWGYLAGYIDMEEAYYLAESIALRLKDTFTSWDEATENYMDGYAYWSRTDVSKSNTVYTQRLAMYEALKAGQAEKGMLFNPDVWTQPVKGCIPEE